MKSRLIPIVFFAALWLTACNFTLAADITPPPDYVPPTPMPTLGPLYPAAAPDVARGAAIYAQHCAACHGNTGLGDGPQGIQLEGVTVPALALPEIARTFPPAQWFRIVSQGNLQRYMPPFIGTLTEGERWDVVAYLYSLHTTPAEIAEGKRLFEANCAQCATGPFADLEYMAGLSPADLARIIKEGNDQIPAFGASLTEAEIAAVGDYLRTLSFAPPLAPTPAAEAASAVTPQSDSTPGTPAAAGTSTASAGTGTVSGSVEVPDSSPLPADLAVVLHGYDHSPDQGSGPVEVLTLTGSAGPDGTFRFENVALAENRIFLSEVEYQGIQYQSDFVAVKPGDSQISLPPLKLFEASSDLRLLQFGQIHIYSDFASQGTAQFLEIYTFSNPSGRAVIVPTDGTSVPFIGLPQGAQSPGFEAGQDSAPYVSAKDGIAILPSEKDYSLIAFFNLPYDQELEINQPFVLDTPSILLLIPEGMKVEGDRLSPGQIQPVQGANFQTFRAADLKAGEVLSFTISGQPAAAPSATGGARQNIWIGVGGFGLALILFGGWLYFRERRLTETEEDLPEDEFETSEEVMDAILALDDLHRAGKLGDAVYQSRRAELKEILKGMV
jgi:mono/diheme cytochrome c family protein